MAQFAQEYLNLEAVQQCVGEFSWGHNILLLQKSTSQENKIWYAQKSIEIFMCNR
ncbi:hypothetical protein SCG7086_CL_00020 [Chlamydiales bacterium SCGC AG-110-P3]|nr:hypothetical protein SCG7086_CL_00020 [Chlamydiales bacterium SCGC AG-110-P3]